MEEVNITAVSEFIILGFPEFPELQMPLFCFFSLIYLIILMGNLTIISVTCLDPRLHTPMYFFLCNLSFLDIFSTSVTLPKLLDIFLRENRRISAKGCFAQMHMYLSFICVEFVLLAIMAYDRYVAVCLPLRYALIMNHRIYISMATVTWIFGFLEPVAYTVLVSHFSYCGSRAINHFFCDLSALQTLSCSSTYSVQCILYILGVFLGISCFALTLTSYVCIISVILKIQTVEERRKAFSTCTSHLTVVILFYGILLCSYLRPISMQSMDQNKLFAVLYNILIPVFNPLIYSLKNKEVKATLRKMLNRKKTFCKVATCIVSVIG